MRRTARDKKRVIKIKLCQTESAELLTKNLLEALWQQLNLKINLKASNNKYGLVIYPR